MSTGYGFAAFPYTLIIYQAYAESTVHAHLWAHKLGFLIKGPLSCACAPKLTVPANQDGFSSILKIS